MENTRRHVSTLFIRSTARKFVSILPTHSIFGAFSNFKFSFDFFSQSCACVCRWMCYKVKKMKLKKKKTERKIVLVCNQPKPMSDELCIRSSAQWQIDWNRKNYARCEWKNVGTYESSNERTIQAPNQASVQCIFQKSLCCLRLMSQEKLLNFYSVLWQ